MRELKEIIIHCTATRAKWYEDRPVAEAVKELTRWHVEDNGWSDCGYHFAINRSGELGEARPLSRTGAHCRGRNKSSVGVTILGGRGGQQDDEFLENFTEAQDLSLRELIADLTRQSQRFQVITNTPARHALVSMSKIG